MSAATVFAFAIAACLLAAPFLLAALGELLGQRAGILNVGIEGTVLAGCFAAFAVAEATGDPWLAAALALPVGAALGLGFGLFTAVLRVDAVVAGTALNLLALGATATLRAAWYGKTGAALIVPALPRFALPALALALVPALLWFLYRTRAGLELRAAGENAGAAAARGVPVVRIRLVTLAVAGALAALAGAELVLGETRTFVEGMSAGRGFVALAIVVCGRWHPLGVGGASLLFGAITALQFQLQAAGLGVPYQFFLALPYAGTLALLAFRGGRGGGGPAGLGGH